MALAILKEPIPKYSLVEQIAQRIESAILDGSIPLGGKLMEKPLAESLGVSRGPLREAIRSLEGRHLVERTPNYSARVIDLSFEDISEIYDVREVLEGFACRLATERMSDAAIKKLFTVVSSSLAERYDQKKRVPGVQHDFHMMILAGAKNRRLERILYHELYYPLKVYRARSVGVAGRYDIANQEHLAIVEAMIKRDGAAAADLMQQHIRSGRDNILRAEFKPGSSYTTALK